MKNGFILSDDGKTLYGLSKGSYGLKEIIIPEGIERISITNSQYRINNDKVVLPTTLKCIEARSFENSNIKEIVFSGDNEVLIFPYAFAYSDELVAVTLPKNQVWIKDFVFYHCTKLKTVHNTRNIRSVHKYAFGECHSLERFEWKNVSTLDVGAFYNCRNLYLGDLELSSIEEVKPYTFAGCGDGSLTLPSTLKVIESFGFANSVVNLRGRNQYFNDTWVIPPMPTKLVIKSYAFAGSRINTASFPIYGEYVVEDYAFDHCNALETICISGDITIGNFAFSNVYSRVDIHQYSGGMIAVDDLRSKNNYSKINFYRRFDANSSFEDRKFSKRMLDEYKFRDYCVRNDKMSLYRNVNKVRDKVKSKLSDPAYAVKSLKAYLLELTIHKKR